MDNPFKIGGIASGVNFTDRVNETRKLKANFENGVNTIIISPRRWGKSSLVEKVAGLVRSSKIRIVMIDASHLKDEDEFYKAFLTAVLKETSSKIEEWIDLAKRFLSRITPKITVGTEPDSEFSISMDLTEESRSAEEILELPEKIAKDKEFKIVVCIDEFQQIADFKDSLSFQMRLRSIWQKQQNVSYCLYGSRKHLLTELINSTSKPFYLFGEAIFLQKIAAKDWVDYIVSRYQQTGKSISEALAEKICSLVDCHSLYVQQLAWNTWVYTDKEATENAVDAGLEDLILQNAGLYEEKINKLTVYQLNYMKALASGFTDSLTKRKSIERYNLGSSANVVAIRKALIDAELIDIENGKEFIADPVLARWFEKMM